jgi:hypothetical protein
MTTATQELLFELEEKPVVEEVEPIEDEVVETEEAEAEETETATEAEAEAEEEEEDQLPLRKEYKGYSTENLCDAPDQTLLELLLMCHPDDRNRRWLNNRDREEAYDIGRGDVLCAIQKRGDRILCSLGYPTKLASIYINKYTGDRHAYSELVDRRMTSKGDWNTDRINQSENWTILEHWLPEEKADPKLKLKYLKRELAQLEAQKNPYYGKAEHKKKIKQAELDVRMEEIKVSALKNS